MFINATAFKKTIGVVVALIVW